MATFSGRGIQVCAHNDYSSVQVSNCPGGRSAGHIWNQLSSMVSFSMLEHVTIDCNYINIFFFLGGPTAVWCIHPIWDVCHHLGRRCLKGFERIPSQGSTGFGDFGVFDLKMGLSSSNCAILIEKTEQLTQQTCWSGPCDLMVWCGMMCNDVFSIVFLVWSQEVVACFNSWLAVCQANNMCWRDLLIWPWPKGGLMGFLARWSKKRVVLANSNCKDENGWTSNWKGE